MGFVANFVRYPTVQKFWKSVNIWQSYRGFKSGNVFETQCRIDDRLYFAHADSILWRAV